MKRFAALLALALTVLSVAPAQAQTLDDCMGGRGIDGCAPPIRAVRIAALSVSQPDTRPRVCHWEPTQNVYILERKSRLEAGDFIAGSVCN